jgi:pseudouridine-5'-phosphate glycosidase
VTARLGAAPVALETTLLCHGVPRDQALPLHDRLDAVVREHGATPALVGLLKGRPVAGLTRPELERLLAVEELPKVNTANLGPLMHQRSSGATTVSATMEIAHAAGVRVFSTGGLGGVHPDYATRLDISSDLTALTRFPLAVVASGVKSLLDVASTREALETLGVPVLGWRTDSFPAFYLRESDARVDARFDDADDLAAFLSEELPRTRRAALVASPVPEEQAIDPDQFNVWLDEAASRASPASGRDVTPTLLAALHECSGAATLRANLALVESNTRLAATLAARMEA